AEYPGKVTCGVCEEDYEETFDLSQLPVKGLAAQPLRPNENLFLFTLPRSKRQVVYRLLTGKDELELSRAQSQRKRVLKTQVENSVTSRLMHSIVSIDGEEDGQKIAYAVKNMIAYDSMALREEIDRVEPGVEMKQNSICPSCGEESEVRVPMGLNFFWPNAGK